MAAEIVGGIVFNSVALLADAVHMLSDVIGLAVALVAQTLLSRPASARHTYGLQRAEVLGAIVNGVALFAAVLWIVIEALRRFAEPEPVSGGGVAAVAALGLAVNVASAFLLSRVQGTSLNMRGAFLHMSADAAGSAAALGAGVAIAGWGATWADPVASLVISLLIVVATFGLVRDALHVFMEGVPRGIDVGEIEAALRAHPSVSLVHHLHVWNLASDVVALSAHVVVERASLHEAQLEREKLKALLEDRFGISHATLELECHPCTENPVQDGGAVDSRSRHGCPADAEPDER